MGTRTIETQTFLIRQTLRNTETFTKCIETWNIDLDFDCNKNQFFLLTLDVFQFKCASSLIGYFGTFNGAK